MPKTDGAKTVKIYDVSALKQMKQADFFEVLKTACLLSLVATFN